MRAYLLIKTLFKTVEYKLINSESLKITELTLSGVNSKTILLSSVNMEEGQSIPSFVSWLVLLVGSALIFSVLYLSQFSTLLNSNTMNAIFFLATISGVIAFICKPMKTQNYRDLYSNNIVLKLNNNSDFDGATNHFIDNLNLAIKNAKEKESNKINLKKNAKSQYEIHNKNVDDLFNLGLIDEVLYNRICNSMHEKVFGKLKQHATSKNVIYLNR